MGKTKTLLTNQDLTVMLRHLREHYWCLLERLNAGVDDPAVRDDFSEIDELLVRYRADLKSTEL
jgi:hypothetical protein